MIRRKPHARELSREVVERIARIVGGAAARALQDAATHDGPVRFWQTDGGWLLVEKSKKGSLK